MKSVTNPSFFMAYFVDMKPDGQPEQAGCGEYPKSCVVHMLVLKFLCNINDTRALIVIGLCLLVTSQ